MQPKRRMLVALHLVGLIPAASLLLSDYRQRGIAGLFGWLMALGVLVGVVLTHRQGKRLADAYMRKAELKPDRDEGQASL